MRQANWQGATVFARALALAAVIVASGTLAAAPAEMPPPGFGKYVMVLWPRGTPLPGQPKGEKPILLPAPDIPKLGGRVLQQEGETWTIMLPLKAARELRLNAAVLYVQRIWMGEDLSGWDESFPRSSALEAESESDTNLTWSAEYTYDGSGNITSAPETTGGVVSARSYTYDGVDRLKSATIGVSTETYEYDAFGNMVSKGVSGKPALAMPTDPSTNRMVGPTYDVAGNVSTGDGRQYTYDSLNMMTHVDGTTVHRRFIYDADDERIGWVNDASLSRWTIRDFQGRVLREFKSDDNIEGSSAWFWQQDYIYADGAVVAGERQDWGYTTQYRYGGKRHYHLDHLGSVRFVTDGNGRSIAENTYYPFGVQQNESFQEPLDQGNPYVDKQRFAGHMRDYLGVLGTENQDYLDYMHARYYDPHRGRFLSVDPVLGDPGDPQTWNRYVYARDNPLLYTDPTGEQIVVTAERPLVRVVPVDRSLLTGRSVFDTTIVFGSLRDFFQWYGSIGREFRVGYENASDTVWDRFGRSVYDNPEDVLLLGGGPVVKLSKEVMLAMKADDLIRGSLKASASYRAELAHKTYAEIIKLSKGSGPVASAAKGMKKLIEGSERLLPKVRGK